MMSEHDYDTVIVGAGAGGLTVATGLAGLGRSVALVESGPLGGDCTNVGCIPSKTLIEWAHRTQAHPTGQRAELARGALAEARARRDEIRGHEEAMIADAPTLELIRGRARLVPVGGARAATPEVHVGKPDGATSKLRATRVVLATGSTPVVPPLPGLDATVSGAGAVLTNATLFDLEEPPAHLAILGGGVIGCELAFAFARLGSHVTVVEMADRILPPLEPEAAAIVHARLSELGVDVHVGTRLERYDAEGGVAHATVPSAVGEPTEISIPGIDRLLVAVGRRPASDDLGLDDVGIARDPRGIVKVGRGYRTSAPGVFAIGDLIGGGFTHVANLQGRRLVRALALPLPLVPEGEHGSIAFTEPEIAQVGPSLATLQQRWSSELLAVQRIELAETDRGRTMGLRDGFVQLVAMRGSGRLLAATVVAPSASEMVPLLVWAQRNRLSLWRLSRMEVPYPALADAVRAAADRFVFTRGPRIVREIAAYLRYRWA